MKKIYICSPYREFKDGRKTNTCISNLCYANKIALQVIQDGDIPLASHIFYARMLQDGLDEESPWSRNAGMRLAEKLIEDCDELMVCPINGYISEGMKYEIKHAKAHGIKIVTARPGV